MATCTGLESAQLAREAVEPSSCLAVDSQSARSGAAYGGGGAVAVPATAPTRPLPASRSSAPTVRRAGGTVRRTQTSSTRDPVITLILRA